MTIPEDDRQFHVLNAYDQHVNSERLALALNRAMHTQASHVTARRGGDGAVREAIEWLLDGAGRLDEALAAYRERVTGPSGEASQ